MSHYRRCRWWIGILGVLVGLTSCTYETAIRRLSPAERAQVATYRKLMTSPQVRTYLRQATAAERTAYLAEIGLSQRFEALEALDREAVLNGWPRPGMRADALRFLWGEPYYTRGHTNHYEYWYYLGSSLGLADYGNNYRQFGTRVEVYLVDGRVVWWRDRVASRSGFY